MSRASVLARGRAAAQAGMVDTCTIRRVTHTQTSTIDGAVTYDYATVYNGPCRIQQTTAQGQEEEAGEARLVLLNLQLQLPMTVTGLQEADQVTLTASVNDPDLVGRVFLIRDLAHKSEATARRVQITEATS